MDYRHPKAELIYEQLEVIASRIPTTYFMAVITVDGLRVAVWKHKTYKVDATPEARHEDRITATTAAMEGLSDRIAHEVSAGNHRLNVLKGDKGTIFMMALGDDYLLSFGVREIRTIDTILVILHQQWGELLMLLNVPAPELR